MSSHVQGRTTKRFAPLLAAVTAAIGLLALAGCGSSSTTTGSTSSTPAAPATSATTTPASSGATANVEANPEGKLEYNTSSLTAPAGKVSIDFTNTSPLGHNVTVESSAGKVVGATPTFQGGSKTLTLNLKPGTYKFFCSVPGHRMGGMEGTLTVK